MGLFGRLFGKGGGNTQAAEAVEHEGCRIRPEPYAADGQFQTAGTIEKDFSDGVRTHRFIRAEKHASREAAIAFSLAKGRQIVDERGDRLFDAR